MKDITEILLFVVEAVWRVWPLFLLSIALSVLIRALKLEGLIRKAFSANAGKAILLATLVGAFSPFCSCTVVPVIAGLLLSGVPLAPIMSFWIASPTMDPEIFTLSVGVLGWPLALARLGSTLVVSLAAGYVTLFLTRAPSLRFRIPGLGRPVLALAASPTAVSGSLWTAPAATQSSPEAASCASPAGENSGAGCSVQDGNACGCTSEGSRQEVDDTGWRAQLTTSFKAMEWPAFAREMARQSWLLGRWLLLAFVLEALITAYVPQAAVAQMLGKDNALAVPLAALVGIPLYLNNFGALPIVSGLLEQGMQPGAAIAFLIAGPVTTIPAMTAVFGVVRRRIFALYLGTALFGAILMGFVVNILLGWN